jgi:phage virion morphogenesis protein
VSVRLVGDTSRLDAKLKRLAKPRLRQAALEIGEALTSSTIRRFNQQRDPEGKPWQPLAAATIMGSLSSRSYTKKGKLRKPVERKLLKRKILIQSAQLRNSISSKVRGSTVHVGTNKKYARLHQLGGEAGRKTARVTVPARSFLGISNADQTVITRAVERHVLEGL